MATSGTQKAIKIVGQGRAELQSDVPIPRIRDDYILAETRAFALNPTDYIHIDTISAPGPLVGCDWSGVVTAVGKNVTRFKAGDAVSGVCHGGNSVEPEDGAFAETVACKEHATLNKPNHLSFQEAATLGVGIGTIGQALYWILKLPLPSADAVPDSGPTVLVYGGSSATGTLIIQAAKLSGCRVYATCSSANFELVKSRGANGVFDYNTADCKEQLLAAAGSSINYAIDCIGNDESSGFCAKVLSPAGGHYHSILYPLPKSFKAQRPEETAIGTAALGYVLFGEEFVFPDGTVFPAEIEQERFAKKWILIAEDLIGKGLIKPHPVAHRDGGLHGILEGLNVLAQGGARGQKFVYTRGESDRPRRCSRMLPCYEYTPR